MLLIFSYWLSALRYRLSLKFSDLLHNTSIIKVIYMYMYIASMCHAICVFLLYKMEVKISFFLHLLLNNLTQKELPNMFCSINRECFHDVFSSKLNISIFEIHILVEIKFFTPFTQDVFLNIYGVGSHSAIWNRITKTAVKRNFNGGCHRCVGNCNQRLKPVNAWIFDIKARWIGSA